MRTRAAGFSLVEVLAVVAVTAVLSTLVVRAVVEVRVRAREAVSAGNVRQLAQANLLHAAEHGRFAPWGDVSNTVRWHSRRGEGGAFGSGGGFLSPYLDGGQVRRCPVFDRDVEVPAGVPFDAGAGGYGYNATYIGGNPSRIGYRAPAGSPRGAVVPWWAEGSLKSYVAEPSTVVMFTSTAIVRGGGLVETDQSVPFRAVVAGGLGERLTPTVHFRFRGRAVVAWADGRVTFERRNPDVPVDQNIYGEDNTRYDVGWFGSAEWNGPWNPGRADARPY